jgi:phosphoserine aminotransferase
MKRVYNFNAGPAMLPDEVLKQAQDEMLDWHGTGMSIMELGHRGPEFGEVANQAEQDLRELMSIPENYQVLFIPGGASAQFAMVPINLMTKQRQADYVDTGIWSKKAIAEAKRYGEVNVIDPLVKEDDLISITKNNVWKFNSKSAYVHYTPNETIDGIQFDWLPKVGDKPLVADMSSMILSSPIDVKQYGIIYAGAQKNLGQAGITIIIVRDDLIADPLPGMPSLYSYKLHADNHSFYNTPPTYSWYITGLVLAWLKRQGGVKAIYEKNKRNAAKVYNLMNELNDFYHSNITPDSRSMINIVINLNYDDLLEQFITESTEAGLVNLRGHRIAGGIRASLYNAMPEEGVDELVSFMRDFANRNG